MITIDISIKILICSLILNLLFVYSWKYIDKKLNLNKNFTFNIQNTHVGSIPRLGGIAILISLLFGTILIDANYEKNFLLYLILFSLPFILLTLIDDFFQNIRPLIRLGLMVICSFAYIYYNIDNYPKIEFLSLEFLLNNPKINLIIFSLGMCTYMNGVNFIDGVNGLSILTILSTLLSLLFLTIFFNMHEQINLIIFLIAAILPFFFINYPFGKIFLGDHGAYFIGWFTAIITIEVMAQNSQILNWCAIVILSYPLLEVLFSFFRKISENKNPLYPDQYHLHLKLYAIINLNSLLSEKTNPLIAPILSILWIYPLIVIPWIFQSKTLILICLIFYIILYLSFYLFIPRNRT